MTPRRRAARLLVAATVTTSVVTVSGVLLGPAASDIAAGSSKAAKESEDADAKSDAPEDTSMLKSALELAAPQVATQTLADFAEGDGLPERARIFDSGANATGMALTSGRLTHGPAEGAAAGFVETRLASDVALLGVRVVFPGPDSGSVALVGWQSSLVKARQDFDPTPATGMRLVAGPDHWELSVVNNNVTMLETGTYEPVDGPSTFELVREGSTLYVVDPAGAVTVVEEPRAAKLAGPWASWGLTETGPEQVPAAIEAVWAG